MANQVAPISGIRRGRDGLFSPNSYLPDNPVSVLSLSVRVGRQKLAIGFVQSIGFSIDREVEEYYEITPYAPNDFGTLTAIFNNQSFNESIVAEGEPVTLIPGVQKPITVSMSRPMLYSSNMMEALFKAGGAGEFTTQEMTDFRYVADDPSSVSFGGRLLTGAAAGALLGLGRNGTGSLTQSAGAGALAGAVQATLSNPNPERVRYGATLQQVRPLTISFIVFSPNADGSKQVAYQLDFIDGWAQKWSVDEITADGEILMESMEIVFPRVRTITDFS